MKKNILIISLVLLLTACSSKGYKREIAVQSPFSAHGKKYHFIIENRFKSTTKDISVFKSKHVTQLHIYTDSLNEVRGNKVLFSTSKEGKVYKLSSQSIFIFNKNELIVKNTQWCDKYLKKCSDSGINKKYSLKDFSSLTKVLKNTSSESEGYFR